MGVQGKRALAFGDRYRHSNAGNWYVDSSNQSNWNFIFLRLSNVAYFQAFIYMLVSVVPWNASVHLKISNTMLMHGGPALQFLHEVLLTVRSFKMNTANSIDS